VRALGLILVVLAVTSVILGDVSEAMVIYGADSAAGDPWFKVRQNAYPNWVIELHKINNLWLSISNGGTFGSGMADRYIDPETGMPAPSCEYPAGSDITYLFLGALWAGAVVGTDTLVSVGFDGNRFVQEFWPGPGSEGGMIRRSNMKTSMEYSPEAFSEQDFVCSFTDTFTSVSLTGEDPVDNRPHIPIGLTVNQRSYGWSYDYAADFIMIDYTIRNINRFPIRQLYLAIYVDADVYHQSVGGGWGDDICGYVHDIPSPDFPGFRDTVRIAWTADNDGDPGSGNVFDFRSPTALTGTAVLRTPNPDLKYSFNWWIASGEASLDWGPRKAGTPDRPFRDFGFGLGSPEGDRNKYYIMSGNEFDYDELESAVTHTGEGWLPPPRNAENIADGLDARYLFSFGPFDLNPGDTLPITLAYVAGANFHVAGNDFREYWDPYNPTVYQRRLNFEDVGVNARWAQWIFDNPGVDTDGDGDSGKVRWVVDSTSMDSTRAYYRGDGVPDFRGASPPPAPKVRVTPEFGQLRIGWNGQVSEENVDIFSGLQDFEGYRVYYGEDNRMTDYVLVAGYDVEDYNVYWFNGEMRRWEISATPVSGDSLVRWFGSGFEPGLYDRPEASYFWQGEAYYFVGQDWNRNELGDTLGIHRVYPDADRSDAADTTEAGQLRYYEYEYVLRGVEPTKPYYVSVTAFDYGSRRIALSSLESSPNLNAVLAYALPSTAAVEAGGLRVGVYPNPYRIDGGYARAGYENRDRTKSAERSRAINFYNLPAVCTIRIYSVDGDLVEEIEHNYPGGGPAAQHERWNLISRNTQAVVTGIYIYHVSSPMGEQLGKIVIIK